MIPEPGAGNHGCNHEAGQFRIYIRKTTDIYASADDFSNDAIIMIAQGNNCFAFGGRQVVQFDIKK